MATIRSEQQAQQRRRCAHAYHFARKLIGFTLETTISELRRAISAFPIDAEWERDNLSYLAFGDFARFICSEAEVLQYATWDEEAHALSKVPVCMEFLERALEQRHDLVLDCIGRHWRERSCHLVVGSRKSRLRVCEKLS